MKRKKKVIYTIWTVALLCILAFVYRYRILLFIDGHFGRKCELSELTTEQKLEDFEEFYSALVTSSPFLDDVNELYGIDFKERKEYYIEQVKATDNNVEFYGVLKAISAEMSSFHTDVCFPLYYNLLGINCYNSKRTISRLGMKGKMQAWSDEFESLFDKYEGIDVVNTVYVDGKYYTMFYDNSKCVSYELKTIDGIEASDYIVNNLSVIRLCYDSLNNQAYRKQFVLNDSVGMPVEVVWSDENGQSITKTLYKDIGIELYYGYGYIYENPSDNATDRTSVTMYRDNKNKLEYVKINDFSNNQGNEVKEYLKDTPYDTIIIDLRDNYGGKKDYAVKYLYPDLYDKNITFESTWKVIKSDKNKCVTDNLWTTVSMRDKKDEKYFYYSKEWKYVGKADSSKNVYYLVGTGTGSAADAYVAMIKANDLGTVIGSNTGGEGLGDSFVCHSLKNSSLVYIYYPSTNCDELNSRLGTSPDIYINQTLEDYKLEKELALAGKPDSYSNRMTYDTVLKYTVELIMWNRE